MGETGKEIYGHEDSSQKHPVKKKWVSPFFFFFLKKYSYTCGRGQIRYTKRNIPKLIYLFNLLCIIKLIF